MTKKQLKMLGSGKHNSDCNTILQTGCLTNYNCLDDRPGPATVHMIYVKVRDPGVI